MRKVRAFQFASTYELDINWPKSMRGLWVWPESEEEQRKVIEKAKSSPHLVETLTTLARKDGLSNSQIDQAIKTSSQWNTLWMLRELMALGLIDYKVDFFGGPGKYSLTELGKSNYTKITEQPLPQKPAPAQRGTQPQQAAPKPPTPPVPPTSPAMAPRPPAARPATTKEA